MHCEQVATRWLFLTSVVVREAIKSYSSNNDEVEKEDARANDKREKDSLCIESTPFGPSLCHQPLSSPSPHHILVAPWL